MRTIAVLMVLVSTAHAEELVGKVVPPFPDGMYEGEGTCTGIGSQEPCRRSVAVLLSAEGKKVGVYAAASAERRGFWIVSDLLPYPKVGKSRDLVLGVCRYDRVDDGSVVAVVRNSKQSWLMADGWAYRVDDASGKFVKLDAKHVDCVNTALDAD
jgi:hypothetical protein